MDKLAPLTLPSGGVVVFSDPVDLNGEDYRKVVSMLSRDGLESESVGMIVDAVHGVATVLIESWTIPYQPKGSSYQPGMVPIPRDDFTVLGLLRIADYGAIVAAVRPAVQMLFPTPPSPDQSQVTGSPTVPAGG